MKSYHYRKGKRLGEIPKPKRPRCETSGKVSFQSHTQALIAGGKVMREGMALRAYQCPDCDLWHLTSKL